MECSVHHEHIDPKILNILGWYNLISRNNGYRIYIRGYIDMRKFVINLASSINSLEYMKIWRNTQVVIYRLKAVNTKLIPNTS